MNAKNRERTTRGRSLFLFGMIAWITGIAEKSCGLGLLTNTFEVIANTTTAVKSF
jgi:hypothetical protein